MRNAYLAILGIITLAAIVVGCMIHMGGIFGFPFSFGSGEKSNFKESYTGIKSIDVEAGLLDIEIVNGSEFSVAYDGNKELQPEVKVDNGILKINQKGKHVNVNKLNNYKSHLVLTVPTDAKLDDVDLELDMGNMEIADITASTLDIDADMGNVVGNNIVAESVKIDASMGNVELNEAEFKKLSADCDMGNVEVKSVISLEDYRIKAKSNMGNVELNGDKVKGAYTAEGDDGDVEVEAGMGNVIINW